MKAAYIVDDPDIAGILIDPMRRAILTFLRQKPMTQAQLADELGLSDASLNYHMKILKNAGLVAITKKVAEEHGIIQKFFSPAAYLFVYDLDALPKDIARYFYPVSIERSWGVLATLAAKNGKSGYREVQGINGVTEGLSRLLVETARPYARKETAHGNEALAHEIYSKAVKAWIDREDAPRQRTRQRARR
ncbi:MAG: ArsR/SmtB family transcription factor [Nitrososphaera sp.]|uniref:ArsR/SmtB family transcription factor n=1 Tax=Nitrososphaera sp. TaxID=1971748 RepID=UPI003D6ED700